MRYGKWMFDDATLSTLTYGTAYGLAIQPQGTGNVTISVFDVDVNADWSAWPGGVEHYLQTRADAGAWTAASTRRLAIEPILADITVPAGGSPVTGYLGMP